MRFLLLAALCVLFGCSGETEPIVEPQGDPPSSQQNAAMRISETALASHFSRIRSAAKQHQALNASYPSEVGQLVDGGLLHPGQEMDPWGRPYVLRVDDGSLVIISLGPDGAPGGGDDRVSLGP